MNLPTTLIQSKLKAPEARGHRRTPSQRAREDGRWGVLRRNSSRSPISWSNQGGEQENDDASFDSMAQ